MERYLVKHRDNFTFTKVHSYNTLLMFAVGVRADYVL